MRNTSALIDGPAAPRRFTCGEPTGTIPEPTAPRLRGLIDEYETVRPQLFVPLAPLAPPATRSRLGGAFAAATIAAAVGLFAVALLNLLVPLLVRLGLNEFVFGDPVRSSAAAMTCIGVWLFTWIGLHEIWRKQTVRRVAVYGWLAALVISSAVLMLPPVYRMFE